MSIEKLNEYLDSPEGRAHVKEYFGKLAEQQALKRKRFEKLDEWLKHNSFDMLLYRLILEHDDKYREKCYDRGVEPHMNNVLSFVFDYACNRGKQLEKIPKDLECDFPQAVYEFRGYYFEIIWGQGSITAIYNKKDLKQIFWKW